MTNAVEPQNPETPWLAHGNEKRAAVRDLFGDIAPSYDAMNSVMSMNLHHRWRAFAVSTLKLQRGDSALDVCCGTGDFMVELRKVLGREGRLIGVDFCAPMLAKASTKIDRDARLLLADACALPFGDSEFEGVTVGWGIRNVPDIDGAHREAYRVLVPGGRFVSIDMATPRNPIVKALSNLLFQRGVAWLGRVIGHSTAYSYLPKSTQLFKTREELADSMRQAGFVDVAYKDLFFGNICVHMGRRA